MRKASIAERARFIGISMLVPALLLLQVGVALAQQEATLRLDPVAGSGVSGTATVAAANGGTVLTLDVTGLASGARVESRVHAGTCAQPSASFAPGPTLTADASGRATGTGQVLFRGTEAVALSTFTDGAHVVTLVQSGRVAACGSIPMAAAEMVPGRLPAAGGPAPAPAAGLLVAVGLLALGSVLLLRQR